jgi:hypothetical protein
VPSQEYVGDSNRDQWVAFMLSKLGSYHWLHFQRPGRWSVPLAPAVGTSAPGSWEVRAVDYWRMTVTVVATLHPDAREAVLDVPELPGNYEIARVA